MSTETQTSQKLHSTWTDSFTNVPAPTASFWETSICTTSFGLGQKCPRAGIPRNSPMLRDDTNYTFATPQASSHTPARHVMTPLISRQLTSPSLAISWLLDSLTGRLWIWKVSILTTGLSELHLIAHQTARSASAVGGERLPKKYFAPVSKKTSAHFPSQIWTVPKVSIPVFGKLSESLRLLSRLMFQKMILASPTSHTCLHVPESQ